MRKISPSFLLAEREGLAMPIPNARRGAHANKKKVLRTVYFYFVKGNQTSFIFFHKTKTG